MASSSNSGQIAPKSEVLHLSEADYWRPIRNPYLRKLADTKPDELVEPFNPGPTNPDGTINFRCHCVGHLVASPCGHEFRQAVSCQKAAKTDEESAACVDKLISFMQCAERTQCFHKRKSDKEKAAAEAEKSARAKD